MFIIIVAIIVLNLITTGVNSTCTTPNGETGQCILFQKCQPFTRIWNSRTHKNIKFFRSSHCGWAEGQPLVCCGTTSMFTNDTETNTKSRPIASTSTEANLTPDVTSIPNTIITELFTTQMHLTSPPISSSTNIITTEISTSQLPHTSPPIRSTTDTIITEVSTTQVPNTSPPISSSTEPELYTSAPVTESTTSTSSIYKNHRNMNLLPIRGQCGIQTTKEKIFGGNVTDIDDYPWLAILGYKYGENVTFHCGGSLINKRYVLTAAHCIAGRNIVSVRMGEYNTETENDCVLKEGVDDCTEPHQDFSIEETVLFDSYRTRDRNRKNDIALLRLSSEVQYNDFVKPICLPINGERVNPGEKLTIAGWGLTELNITSSIKQEVDVPVWSDVGCHEIYSIGFGLNLTDEQFCAGGNAGKDACTGDSGGPLMRKFQDATDYYAEGIVSFGSNPCGKTGIPGVYVRVSQYIEWILDNMKPF